MRHPAFITTFGLNPRKKRATRDSHTNLVNPLSHSVDAFEQAEDRESLRFWEGRGAPSFRGVCRSSPRSGSS